MDSHWVHERPTYRCRHGYSSTRAKPSPRPKILYVREDQLLDRIRRAERAHRLHQRLRAADPNAVAACLRDNNMIVVCDHDAWAIETETASITLTPTASYLPGVAKIPAQRDGDQAKREEPSPLVWK
jgi:hypothetical protein